MNQMMTVGIFIFEEVEVLDFAGPFEVFSVCSELQDHTLFDVFTVAKTMAPINAVNGLSVNPAFDFSTAPSIDILIVCGGVGTRKLLNDNETLHWISQIHNASTYTLSICSGASLLASLNLLNARPYCTHKDVYDQIKKIAPTGIPKPHKRFVQSTNKIYTSAGISAGIDLSFHMIELIHGKAIAIQTANYMEYKLE